MRFSPTITTDRPPPPTRRNSFNPFAGLRSKPDDSSFFDINCRRRINHIQRRLDCYLGEISRNNSTLGANRI
ncbi:unnamed protein product [Lactuca virosa]|uniref:Uncharacterized protein n=1 Tax=Lactuca virosa TaxID=75947 RepID=A0AAU9MBM1_9ASTR|nr:unnamed protein product [Lactuca virosa]